MTRRRWIVLVSVLAIVPVLLIGLWLALVVTTATGLTKLYRIPSSAMEPTLRCAKPGNGCSAGSSDRVLVRTRRVASTE